MPPKKQIILPLQSKCIINLQRLQTSFSHPNNNPEQLYILTTLNKSVYIIKVVVSVEERRLEEWLSIKGEYVRDFVTCGCLQSISVGIGKSGGIKLDKYSKNVNSSMFLYMGTVSGWILKYSLQENKLINKQMHQCLRPQILSCSVTTNHEKLIAWNLYSQLLIFNPSNLELLHSINFPSEISAVTIINNTNRIFHCIGFMNKTPPYIICFDEFSLTQYNQNITDQLYKYYKDTSKYYLKEIQEINQDQIINIVCSNDDTKHTKIVCSMYRKQTNIYSIVVYQLQTISDYIRGKNLYICYPRLKFENIGQSYSIKSLDIYNEIYIAVLYSNDSVQIYNIETKQKQLQLDIKRKDIYQWCFIVDMTKDTIYLFLIKGFHHLSSLVENKQNQIMAVIGEPDQNTQSKNIISEVRKIYNDAHSMKLVNHKLKQGVNN